MDLSLLIASETADCVIYDPYTDEPTGIVITMYGLYSEHYSEAEKANGARKESDSLAMLVDMTKGWENVSLNGESLPFSKENARNIYLSGVFFSKRQKDI